MLTDLVINPFGAHLADMLAVAKAADGADVGAVWVTDTSAATWSMRRGRVIRLSVSVPSPQ